MVSVTREKAIEQLAETSTTLAQLLAEASEEVLDRAEQGGWSARTIAAHLRDDEAMVMRMRLVRLLTEDDPLLPDFDQEAWAAQRSTARDRKDHLLADFALQRQASLNLLRRITVPEWERSGRHEVNGRLTVADWVEHWAEHDAEHIRQLELALGETLGDVQARRAQMVEDARQS